MAVVLAGGEGSRLRPLSYYFQKCMIPVGPRQRPLLEYILINLRKNSLTDVLISVGYKAEQIINYFGEGERHGVKIRYVYDSADLKGTGGAILNIYRGGHMRGYESVLVHYGDILTNINLSQMIGHYERGGADAVIALSRGYQLPVGVAEVDESGSVTSFIEKPTIDILVSIGILVIKTEVLQELEKLAVERRSLDLMADFIPHLISTGRKVKSYVTDSFWYDVGSTERYEKLTNEVFEKYLKPLDE